MSDHPIVEWFELEWDTRTERGARRRRTFEIRHAPGAVVMLYRMALTNPNCSNVKLFHCTRQQLEFTGVQGFDEQVDRKLNDESAGDTAQHDNWQRSFGFGRVSDPAPEEASVLERDGEAPQGS